MKPYTLEWYLGVLEDAVATYVRIEQLINGKVNKQSERYFELAQWLDRRIINKYGENDQIT